MADNEKTINTTPALKMFLVIIWILRVAGIFLLVIWPIAGWRNWSFAQYVGHALAIICLSGAILTRSCGFFLIQTSPIGFATELSFILGVGLLFLGIAFEKSYGVVALLLFSFVIAPLLAVINRLLKLRMHRTDSVATTVAEIIIFLVLIAGVMVLLFIGST